MRPSYSVVYPNADVLSHLVGTNATSAAVAVVEDEEETQAQNKIVLGLLSLLCVYSMAFMFLWALFLYTPLGAIVAAATVWLFAVYHVKIIDGEHIN